MITNPCGTVIAMLASPFTRPSRQSLLGRAARNVRQLGHVVERPGGLHILAETVLVLEHIRLEQMRKLDELLIVRRRVSPGLAWRQDGIGNSTERTRDREVEDRDGVVLTFLQLSGMNRINHLASEIQVHARANADATARPPRVEEPRIALVLIHLLPPPTPNFALQTTDDPSHDQCACKCF